VGRILGGWLLLAALAGCTVGEAPPSLLPSPVPFEPALVLASEPELLDLSPSRHFNFATLRDLWVRITVPDMGHVVTVWLAFTSPTGSLFYETTLRFSPDPSMQEMDMPGMPTPITVRTGKPIPGGWALEYPIAVSGTVFTRNPTPGGWMVQARSEGRTITSDFDVDFSL